ncbi:MAG: beta-galactosidase, partial [Candidatus Omnitrophica bacterium]|nr:beta-galactosidase [Candidatus Omnitrophota bacterium]
MGLPSVIKTNAVGAIIMFLILQTPVFADMEIKEFGGAPGLTVRDKPVPALMGSPAPPGAGFYMNDSKLQMKSAPGQVVRLISNNGFPDAFTIDAELTMSKALSGDANITISVNTLDAYQRYALYLNHAPAGNSIVLSRSERPIYNEKIIDIPYPWVMGQPVRLKMSVDNGHITVHADGKEIGSVTDPEPLPPGLVQLSVYSAEGLVDSIRLKDTEENTLLNEDFDGEASVNWAQVVRKLEQQVPAFAEIGINIYTAGCGSFPSDWTGPGKYNWTSVDNFLKNLAELDPDATLLARVNINPPKWWFNENPDDEMVMIQRGKGEQIKRGFASFSSDEWRKDAGEALKNLIQHLKTSTEGHRITGITICGGVSAEWVYSWGTDFHDYSPVQKAAFRRWLRNRYGNSEKNLQDAWNDGKATFETAEIPAPARRAAGDFYEFFDPSKSRQVTDYMRFHSEAVSGAIVHFARVIKEADTDIFTTVFYGYQFPSYNHYHDMGHNDLLTVLQSPYLDSVCCPHTYQNRQAGGSTTAVLPVDSVRLHGKLWFDEDDTRTHLSTPTSSYGRANNLWESVNILKRNFVHALSKSAGLWHMDWNKGWLADEGIMETIAVHRRMAEESLNKDRRPNSEIAVVVSEQSLDYIRSSFGIVRTMYKNQYHDQMPRIGAPFDTILLE